MERIPRSLLKLLMPMARIYWRFTRPLTMGARGLVRDAEGRVLLVRHTYTPGWYLPGGGVDRGETLQAAVIREIDEEAGVIVASDAEKPRLVGVYANFREFKSDHIALFVVGPGSYERVSRKSLEIAETGFFSPDALPEGTTTATRARIREVMQGLAPPEYW